MDKLWAPWRIEYLLRHKQGGCFLCDMFNAREDRRHLLLERGRTCAVVMNRYPYNSGHLMVAPFRHVDSLRELADEELLELMRLVNGWTGRLRGFMKPDGFNLGVNEGEPAGAGLKDHVHMHVVPRWSGDTNFMPVLADTKVVPQSLLDLYDALCNLLQDK